MSRNASQTAMLVLAIAFTSSCGDNKNTCFSPTSNTDLASMGSTQGCPCDRAVDHDVCAQTSTGSKALVCISGQWQFVYDGPCMPMPPPDASVKTDRSPVVDGPLTCPNDSACPFEVGGEVGRAG